MSNYIFKAFIYFYSLTLFISQDIYAKERIYNFRSYTDKDGLPTNKIRDLDQDNNDVLWMATDKGLINFDGIRFNSINFNTNSSKYSQDFSSIFVDKKSSKIWLTSYNDGLFCYDRTKPIALAITKIVAKVNNGTLIKNELYDVIVSKDNLIYFGGQETDLQVYDPSTSICTVVKLSNSVKNETIYSIKEDSSGKIWIGTRYGGVFVYDPQTKKISSVDVMHTGENAAGHFTFVRDSVYLSYYDHDLVAVANKSFSQNRSLKGLLNLGKNKEFYDNFITGTAYLPNQNKIIASHVRNGLYLYDLNNRNIEHISWSSIVPDRNIHSRINKVLVTKNGYYIASNEGLYFYSDYFNKINQFIPTSFIIKELFKLKNQIWYWSDEYIGLMSEDLKSIKSKISIKGLKISQINCVNDNIYLSTYDKGIYTLNSITSDIEPLKIIGSNHGFDLADCNNVVGDVINNEPYLWIGSWNSGLYLYHIDTKNIKLYNTKNGLIDDKVISVGMDANRTLWLGTDGYGIIKVEDKLNGIFKTYHHENKETLSPNSNTIFTYFLDTKSRFWYGSTAGGVGEIVKSQKGNYEFIHIDNTMSQWMYVRKIKEDIKGRLWLQTRDGVVIYNPFNNFFKQLANGDGVFPNSTFKTINSFFYQDKIIWQTDKGFIFGDVNSINEELAIGEPFISNFKIFDKDHSERLFNETINLKPNENSFSFDLAFTNNMNTSLVNIYYKMEGIDKDWLLANSFYQAIYTNISPGEYKFSIAVEDKNDKTIRKVSSYLVKIEARWYETIFFKVFSVFFISALILGLLFYRLEHHKKINKLQHLFNEQLQSELKENEIKILEQSKRIEIEKEEKLEADFKQKLFESELKAIRSQMNPHFIFNVLNSIESYIVENNQLFASKMIHKFASLTRIVLDNSQLPIVDLESELELVRLYLDLEQERFENKFDYEIYIEPQIDTIVTKVPSMIIQPIVENAIHHGVRHLMNAKGHIKIHIYISETNLFIDVLDNGVGFSNNHNYANMIKTTSFGIKGVDNRLKMLSSKDEKYYSGVYISKEDIGSSFVTKVSMVIPIIIS